MVSFEEYQREKNRKYYTTRGVDFLKDFKTFAADKTFTTAIATDFCKRMTKRGTINVYELGIGTGTLCVSFLTTLRKLDKTLPEQVVYHLCDISDKLVKNAVKRGNGFGFNVDGIVYDGLPNFIKGADYIISNELYSDLPAKLLVNNGYQIDEVFIEKDKPTLNKFEGEHSVIEYMKGMPEGYYIPVNVFAREHLNRCVSGLTPRGTLDVFDYGFDSVPKILQMYQDQWNHAIYRDFGGQVTTDLNFNYMSHGLKATVEPQKEFVEKTLGKSFNEDIDLMRYTECKRTGITTKEEGDFYHMRVKR